MWAQKYTGPEEEDDDDIEYAETVEDMALGGDGSEELEDFTDER